MVLHMNRRHYLASTAATLSVVLAGCGDTLSGSSNDSSSDDDDDTQLYELSDDSEKFPSASTFGDDWERRDEENESWDAVYINGDDTAFITASVRVLNSISEAQDTYDEALNRLDDPNEFSAGDEAAWEEANNVAYAVVRDRNVLASVGGARRSVAQWQADRGYAFTGVEELVSHWQS